MSYLFVTKEGKYVGLDQASGGYTYETDRFQNVQIWETPEEAEDYRKSFRDKDWTLKKFKGLLLETVKET